MKMRKENNEDHPKTDKRDSAKVYDKAAKDFRNIAPELLTYKYVVRPAIKKALDKFVPKNRDEKKVLDVGSASGRNVHALITEGFRAKNIFGVEISPGQVEIARKEIPDASFEVGDISTYELSSNSYNLVIMVMVPEFLNEEIYPVALSNIYQSMRDGGVFIYITTHPDRYKAKYGVTSGEVTTQGPWSNDKFSNYVRSVTKQVDSLKEAGFNIDLTEELDLPEKVDEVDVDRRAGFKHADSHARLVIVASKPSR